MKKNLLILLGFMLITQLLDGQILHSWRGLDRDGKFQESNLLKEWPANGPTMLWSYENLGKGFTSPVIENNKLYVSGMEGNMGYMYIFNLNGKLEKKFAYEKEIDAQYPGTRSTPTIVGNLMYVATGNGVLGCYNLDTGKKVWSKDLFNEYDGSNIRWGFTENLIIDGDVIFASPGGKKYNVVALNRHNGNLVWTSAGEGDLSAYCSPLIINHNGRKIFVNMMQKNIIGLDVSNGKLLWSYPYANQRNIHPNTPIYHNNELYLFSGYGYGGIKLSLNADGTKVEKVWENQTLDPKTGGAVYHNGYIYGAGDRNRRWFSVDWKTGEIKHESREIDTGTPIMADGMIYAYTERGELALIEPLDGSFRVVSKTEVKLGSDQHWAHLLIHNGILYLRHGNAIMAYDVRKN
jgi:outer membrane protein assembly factor BamB